jgi:hypothetical protein
MLSTTKLAERKKGRDIMFFNHFQKPSMIGGTNYELGLNKIKEKDMTLGWYPLLRHSEAFLLLEEKPD